MDFGELLHTAQKITKHVKNEPVKCYKTAFSPPKKEHKSRALSANIQKFLERREQEEKQKAEEARRKREELLALRAQDGKAKKRVQAMLKRTKAANKSAIEDAIDDNNTAVTLGGPSQCDEDDYGYVSQEASAFYNKLMDKYQKAPAEEPLFPQNKSKSSVKDLKSTKDRVRMALLREEEEEMMPHKRKRSSKQKKEEDDDDGTICYASSDMRDIDMEAIEDKPVSKPKPRRPLPPPMDFSQLLKLAEQQQSEPVKFEKKPKEIDGDEPERPMTKKQREEYLRELESKKRKEMREKERLARLNQLQRKEQRGNETQNRTPKLCEKEERKPFQIPKIPKISDKQNASSEKSVGKNNTLSNRPASLNKSMKQAEIQSSSNQSKTSGDILERRSTESSVRKENGIAETKLSKMNGNMNRQKESYDKKDNYMKPSEKSVNETSQIRECMAKPERRPSLSGYSKKLNESLLNKMKERKSESHNYRNGDCDERKQENGKLATKADNFKISKKTDNGATVRRDHEQNLANHKSPNNSSKINQLTAKAQSQRSDVNIKEKSDVPSMSMSRQSVDLNRMKQRPLSDTRPKQSSAQSKSNVEVKQRQISLSDRQRQVSEASLQQKTIDSKLKQIAALDARRRQELLSKSKQLPPPGVKTKQLPSSDTKQLKSQSSSTQSKRIPPSEARSKQFPPPDVRPKQFPPPDVRPKQFPPSDVRPKQFPPADVKSRKVPLGEARKVKLKPGAKRRIIDSDEEYDSELDDFIDDGPTEEEDYSKYIKEIFGYDKSKYRNVEEDDDECMESNFAQISKEEFISTKMGILEDLEDIRMEQEEKKRKAMLKKRRLK